jgi:hypothetical protein
MHTALQCGATVMSDHSAQHCSTAGRSTVRTVRVQLFCVCTHLPEEDASTLQQRARCRPPRAAVADILNNHKAQHKQQLEALHNVLQANKQAGKQAGKQTR